MPRTKLTVAIPPETWMGAVSKRHPDSSFSVLTAMVGEETGVGLIELQSDDPVAVIADANSQPAVRDLDLLSKHDDQALLQVESARPHLLEPVVSAGVPLSTPFTIRDGEVTWELTTTAERLSTLGDRLREANVEFAIEYVQNVEDTTADRLLTPRQQEVLAAAAAAGYYDSPRGASLTEVAESLGVAKATASGVLHRAEGRIVSWFLDEHVADDR